MTSPSSIDPLAERVLSLLSGKPEAAEIVLGGYFALRQYVDYRTTHDIDAWWRTRSNPATERVIRQAMQRVADEMQFELFERRFGETISFELSRERRRHFAFQIAVRSIAIDEPQVSAWPPVSIETLEDNVGSKMNALVDRGSPRDFSDVKHVIDGGRTTVQRCWALWSIKNPGLPMDTARQKVLLHLAAIEARRPLQGIEDAPQRVTAAETRTWFRQVFCQG